MPVTNPYYEEQFAGQAGQNAKAEQVKSEFDGVQAGFDGVLAVDKAAVQGQPGETLTLLPNAAARANKWVKFDASGNPIIVTAPFNFRGGWAASTVYADGDAFNAAPNGSLYYVTTPYTSGSTFGSTDLANTTVIVNLTGLFFTTPTQVIAISGGTTVAAAAGNTYGCDSTAGSITLNLPTATLGDSPVSLTWLGGSASTVTVNSASGQFIDGTSQTQLVMDLTGFSTSLQYWGSAYGWRPRVMG